MNLSYWGREVEGAQLSTDKMVWAVPNYTREQINAAGRAIVKGEPRCLMVMTISIRICWI